jgi:hypothetical protein
MQIVFLHALPFDGRMWSAERDLLDGRVLAPRLYELGDSVEAWAAAVLQVAGPEPWATTRRWTPQNRPVMDT